jgi:type I restriction enzyme S subunit
VRIPVPPLGAQREIAATIASRRAVARKPRAAADREAQLLFERRQATITAAVTGQIEIPGVAA